MSPSPGNRVAECGLSQTANRAAEHPTMRGELFNLYNAGSTGTDTDSHVSRDQEMSQAMTYSSHIRNSHHDR